MAKDARDAHNGGDHPWSIENGDVSTLLLYNSLNKPQTFQVRISEESNSWLQLYSLAPHETRSVSVNDIVRKSLLDHKQRKLPLAAKHGEIQWSTDFGSSGLGRLLVTNTGKSLARNFSCATYYNLCQASFGPDNFEDLAIGDDAYFSSISTNFCVEYSPTECQQTSYTGETESFTTNWQNINPSVVATQSTSSTNMQLQGSTAGSFNISATVQGGSCASNQMGGGGTVRAPAATSIVGSTYSSLYACGPSNNQTGHNRVVYEQIVDQQSPPVPFTANNIIVGEQISPTSRDDFKWGAGTETGSAPTSYQNAPGSTPLNGVIQDSLFNCDTTLNVCNSGGSSLLSVLNQQDLYNGVPLLSGNSLSETCSGFLVNGK